MSDRLKARRAAMAGIGVPARIVPHALPFVPGVSRRFKAEPAHLDRRAATVMTASGAFFGDPPARAKTGFAGIVAVLALAAAAWGVAVGSALDAPENARKASAGPVSALPGAFHALGMDGYRAAAAADPESDLGAQDRFEIARFHRLNEAARAKHEALKHAPRVPAPSPAPIGPRR